ncbi:30S ribosomal protein S2 [candidate division WOR-3 bacterium RBG_13_43_14]|uniref:Small ribosomal subunit protein uS2 n=1 Tax=candidate division WOR-3 bacterium RBG_13_43_14 TaxID=1802590 RepID=A0A1F4UCP0_UNCW3|nr:MAG: 30S ribosomal protein S2 [candidate division WOR-3 bacterium RBG_13_43_14]
MDLVTVEELITAGVHFGHRTKRWNPKMEKFIFGKRNGVHIIDVRQTIEYLKRAYDATVHIAEQGKGILFVGTKKQAKDIIKEEANRGSIFHVTERWLGGLLTNYEILSQRVNRLREFRQMKEDGRWAMLSKKELTRMERRFTKLVKYFSGVKDMDRLPGLVYIIDIKKDLTALREAQRKNIPVVAIVDTNVDPTEITYPIPANDDSIRSITLITRVITDAVLEGRKGFESEEEKEQNGS